MRDPAQFLEKSLSEHGLTVDSVTHERPDSKHSDRFYVHKEIGGETYSEMFYITDEAQFRDSLEKRIAMHAQTVAQSFEEEMTDRVKLGPRSVTVCPYDEPWASCHHCGQEVELEESFIAPMFQEEAEFSCPQPQPRSFKSQIASLSSDERRSLKLYLMGKLRVECDHQCPNSRYYRKT